MSHPSRTIAKNNVRHHARNGLFENHVNFSWEKALRHSWGPNRASYHQAFHLVFKSQEETHAALLVSFWALQRFTHILGHCGRCRCSARVFLAIRKIPNNIPNSNHTDIVHNPCMGAVTYMKESATNSTLWYNARSSLQIRLAASIQDLGLILCPSF